MLAAFLRRTLIQVALASVVAAPVYAQWPSDTVARRDTIARDSLARSAPVRDSLRDGLARSSPVRDSLRDALARDSLVRDSVARAAGAAAVAAESRAKEQPSDKPAGNRPDPSAGPLLLVAEVSTRKLHLYQGNNLVKSFDVAVGTDRDPTPRGTYRIRKIVWNPGWIPPNSRWARGKTPKGPGERGNPMKVVKMFFREPAYFIHGTGDIGSLGSAASHGCLRMHPNDAAEVAQYLMEHGGQPRDESWFRRVLRFRNESRTIYLNSSVPLTIRE